MDNREQYYDAYNSEVSDCASELPPYEETAGDNNEPGRFRAVGKGLLWAFRIVVGITALFGCFIVWVWGLDYLGVISFNRSDISGQNEFNQPSGGYNEFEDFYDYFDDYFGGQMPGYGQLPGGESEDSSEPQAGTPGIGVTIQEVAQLDFVIEDKYTSGLVVIEISPTGALVGKDVQVGDLIVAANDQPIASIEDLDVHLKAAGVGGEMTLTVARYVNGVAATHEVEITLIDLSTAN